MQHDQLEIIEPNGQVRFYALDPALGILNVGQHPDNDIVLAGPGVRLFHGLIDFRRLPYQYIPLDERGDAGHPQELSRWQSVRIGSNELVLVPRGEAGAPGPESSPGSHPPSPPQTTPAPFAPLASPTGQEAPQWPLQPGRALSHTLTIQNGAEHPATFTVHVTGPDPSWVHVSHREIQLEPSGRAAVQLTVAPPANALIPPGVYPLTWQIESPHYPGWAEQRTVHLAVAPYVAVDMNEPDPRVFTSRLFRRSGRTVLTVINGGNTTATVQITGSDAQEEIRFRFRTQGNRLQAEGQETQAPDSITLGVPPGAALPVEVTVWPRRLRLIGLTNHTHRLHFQAAVAGVAQRTPARAATFHSRPLISVGTLLLLALLLALAALFLFRNQLAGFADRLYPSPPVVEAGTLDTGPESAEIPMEALPALAQPAVGTGRPPAQETMTAPDPAKMTYTEMFVAVADLYNLDWRILAAHAYRESSLDPNAVGAAGEYGLMQVRPATWREWAPLVNADDPWNPYENLLVGAAYYAYIHAYFTDLGYPDPKWALAAYNWGPERVATILDRRGSWSEIPLTQRMYTADILLGAATVEQRLRAAEALRTQ